MSHTRYETSRTTHKFYTFLSKFSSIVSVKLSPGEDCICGCSVQSAPTGIDPIKAPPIMMATNPPCVTVGDRFTCFSCELGFSVHILQAPLAGGPWYHPRLIYVGPCLYKPERRRWPSSGRRHNWITATHCGLNWTEDTATADVLRLASL